MKSRWRWALYGSLLGGVWSLSTYFFDLMPYYDWETANSEMLGMNHGQMFGGFFIGGIIGLLAGLARDRFR